MTDAHVVLGRLAPEATLGSGALEVDVDAARAAVGRLAADLDLDPTACAEGIVRVAEANIVRALRVVSVERGRDPRDYALLAFGGAGPLHQAAVARELGCRMAVVPPHAGVLAALGLLAAPVTAEAVTTRLVPLGDVAAPWLADAWDELEGQVRATLADQDVAVASVRRSADLRYRGQAYELEVDVDGTDPGRLAGTFHARHDERYGYSQPDEPVELVNVRARAEAPPPDVPLPEIHDGRGADAARIGVRPVVVDGEERDCPVYDRSRLGAGDRLSGPAIVTGLDTTCLLTPGQTGEVDRIGALLIRWEGAP